MSEVEVQSVAKFLESQRDRLVGYLDIHSYGQMILFPWGYTRDPADDQKELVRFRSKYFSEHYTTQWQRRWQSPVKWRCWICMLNLQRQLEFLPKVMLSCLSGSWSKFLPPASWCISPVSVLGFQPPFEDFVLSGYLIKSIVKITHA